MGIMEMGFYFLIEIQASFFLGIQIFEKILDFQKIFKKLRFWGIIEKCIGWFLVYRF